VSEANLDLALVPEGFEWRINPRGTAPGLMKRVDGGLLFVLPGVPGEMKALYESWVEPSLREAYGDRPGARRSWFRTTGIGESDLYDRIGGLEDLAHALSIAYLPSAGGTAIYLTGPAEGGEEADRYLEEAERRVRKAAGDFLYADSDQELTEHIAALLTSRGQTLATAESCTGGLIASGLTDVPGASDWFLRGWVVYSNEAKEEELRVSRDTLLEHGAVSEEVAREMAEGARELAGSDHSLSVTGIAGPTGGTVDKPVGLVFIGCAGPDGTVVRHYQLGAMGRVHNKERTMANALDLLRRLITGLDPMKGGWEKPR
jgi:nicotinamide-nucleotide amidase